MTRGRPPPFPMTLMSRVHGLSPCPVEGGAGTEPQALLGGRLAAPSDELHVPRGWGDGAG